MKVLFGDDFASDNDSRFAIASLTTNGMQTGR